MQFLPHFNATLIIKTLTWLDPDGILATDACLKGGGGIFMNRYFSIAFLQEFVENISGISQLEAITVIVALKLWCHLLQGLKFIINCELWLNHIALRNKERHHQL